MKSDSQSLGYVPRRILNRYFIDTWIVAFTLQIGQNIYNSALSVYTAGLGYSSTFAGSLAVPYLIMALVGRSLGGYISDHKSRRFGMLAGCLAFLAGSLVFNLPSLAGAALFMLTARAVHGFGYACASTSYSVAVVDVIPPKDMALGIGLNWTAQSIAQALCGVLIIVLVWGGSYQPLFLFSTGCLIFAVIFCILCRYETPSAHADAEPFRLDIKALAHQMFELSVLPKAVALFVFYLGISIITFFALIAAGERGIPGSGLFFTACSIGMTFSNLFLVRLEKRFSARGVLIPVLACSAVSNLLISRCTTVMPFLLAGLLFGFGTGAMPVFQNAAVKDLPVFCRGAGTSTLFLAMDISMGIGPVIWGVVIDAAGSRIAFTLAAVVVFLAMIPAMTVFGGPKEPGKDA